MIHKCIVCNKEFNAIKENHVFCSKKCLLKDWKKKHPDYMYFYRKEFAERLRDYKKEFREKHPEYREHSKGYSKRYSRENPEKMSAIVKANKEIKEIRNCEICGDEINIIKHHFDYSKPLDVTFLCRKCHSKIHKLLKGGIING